MPPARAAESAESRSLLRLSRRGREFRVFVNAEVSGRPREVPDLLPSGTVDLHYRIDQWPERSAERLAKLLADRPERV